MTTKWIPNKNQVIIKIDHIKEEDIKEEIAASGIIIASAKKNLEKIKERPVTGTVVAINPDSEIKFSKGDRVIVRRYIGQLMEDEDCGELQINHITEILAYHSGE